MRYQIHGRDSEAEQPIQPFVVEAEDEEDARNHAREMGMAVEKVELAPPPSSQHPQPNDDSDGCGTGPRLSGDVRVIVFSCPNCQALLKAPAGRAYMHSNCPRCSYPITVPVSSTVPVTGDMDMQEIATIQPRIGPQPTAESEPLTRSPARFGSWILTLGQVVAILVCLAVPVVVWQELAVLAEMEQALSSTVASAEKARIVNVIQRSRMRVLIGGVLIFCLSEALYVAFGRVKLLATTEASQEVEIFQLWRAIEALRDCRNDAQG